MATTRLMPLHTGKGRTVGQAISDILDYSKNPQKTDNGRLITSWQCDSRIADAEFLFTKNQYIQKTGRVRGEDDVIAYHLRQSFVPGEITPEEANRLGCELAKRFTKGKHAYIVCTHIDKEHIHTSLRANIRSKSGYETGRSVQNNTNIGYVSGGEFVPVTVSASARSAAPIVMTAYGVQFIVPINLNPNSCDTEVWHK